MLCFVLHCTSLLGWAESARINRYYERFVCCWRYWRMLCSSVEQTILCSTCMSDNVNHRYHLNTRHANREVNETTFRHTFSSDGSRGSCSPIGWYKATKKSTLGARMLGTRSFATHERASTRHRCWEHNEQNPTFMCIPATRAECIFLYVMNLPLAFFDTLDAVPPLSLNAVQAW